ncbi:peptidoglycan DD-metalloendopeptidase family protein [Motilibacter deserti]|uniref:M23 family metallopeptidase n=1 Tax=Motilibacter deserti TaxID=2714956 RepID=A0ABX0GTF4_9ACTN|nr:peptidoglycan DD-metalloendopeptidase family protein [Motilibacter deserti]NHC13793.1 M23 family metallopeptidase [Motilibacter deserti]
MSSLSASQIYSAAVSAGFSPDDAVTWTAIALAESGGDPSAHNDSGEDSRGLWQINVGPGVRQNVWGDLSDPAVNARAAFEISNGGQNMQPWTVTHDSNAGTSRDYRRYLDQAQAAASGGPSSSSGAGAATLALHADGGTSVASLTGEGPLVRPVEDAALHDSWGAPRSGGRHHEGIDIFADEGTPIHAVASGTVVKGFDNQVGGVVVRIAGDDGRYYYYAHLQEGSPQQYLHVGEHVSAGDVIGAVSDTGNAKGTPPHLHLGIQEDGQWVNPYPILNALPDYDEIAGTGAGTLDVNTLGAYDQFDKGSDVAAADTDRDGLLDSSELQFASDPGKADSDADSLSDAYEVGVLRSNPAAPDTDADGVWDAEEFVLGRDIQHGAVPGTATAAMAGVEREDDDGLDAAFERSLNTDPVRSDTDGDGIDDNLEYVLGTDPLDLDSDDDQFSDGFEIDTGGDALVPDLASPALPGVGAGEQHAVPDVDVAPAHAHAH